MTDIKNVLSKLSREAGKTCGAHYEIYQEKYSESVLKYIETLPELEKLTFIMEAKKIDCDLILDNGSYGETLKSTKYN